HGNWTRFAPIVPTFSMGFKVTGDETENLAFDFGCTGYGAFARVLSRWSRLADAQLRRRRGCRVLRARRNMARDPSARETCRGRANSRGRSRIFRRHHRAQRTIEGKGRRG